MGKGSEKVLKPGTDAVIRQYREVRGTLIRKYRGIGGRYVFVLEEQGTKTKIRVGKALFEQTGLGTVWTMGHINGYLINIRPGICGNETEKN